jgi:hypothetical protein
VNYDRKLEVDSSGQLPNGESFANPGEFRDLVIEQKETFVRCLTKKMLSYATGRQTNSGDRLVVDGIVEEMTDPAKGLGDLVKEIVRSKTFLNN